MGKPTNRRTRARSRGQRYLARKAARMDGKPMMARDHETPPWYTFTVRYLTHHTRMMAPIARLEFEISGSGRSKFGQAI